MRLRLRKRSEDLLCLALLSLVAVWALWPALVQGRVPFATNSVLFEAPWEQARPEGIPRPFDAQEMAQAHRYYPWYVYLSVIGQGEGSLLWNPFEGCGQPFLAVWRTRCLSPFSVPFYLLSVNTAIALSMFLKMLVAGVAAYYVARKFGLRPSLALSAAIAFELSGHIYLWLGRPMSDVMPLLPLLVLSVERLAIGQARFWTVGAIITGLMALGGEPEALAGALLFSGIYFAIRVALQRTSPSPLISFVALMVLIGAGLALAAVQIVPYVEFSAAASSLGRDDPAATLRLADVVLAYLPRFLGRSPWIVTAEGALRHSRVIRLLHVGLAQVLLLSLWFSVRSFVPAAQRRRIEALLWTVLAMGSLAFVAGRALERIPYLRALNAEHFLVGNALALGLAGAAAADEWLLLKAEQCGRALRRLAIYLPLVLLVGVAAALAHQHVPRMDASPLLSQALKQSVLLFVLLLLLAITLLRPSPRIMGYGLAALTCASLVAAWVPGLRYADARMVFPDTPLVQALRAAGARVGGSGRLAQYPLSAELAPQVYSPGGVVLERQQAFLDRLDDEPLLLRRTGSEKLLLIRDDIQGAFAPVRPMLSIDRVFPSGAVLFSDLAALPRARMVYEVRPVSSMDAAALDPDLPPLVEASIDLPASSGPEGQARIETASATRVTLSVETPRPGVLVLADSYYPGWHAAVDGKEVVVFPVDAMFRGVQLDAGTHEVRFDYKPKSLKIGLYTTLIAAAIVLIELRRVFWRAYY